MWSYRSLACALAVLGACKKAPRLAVLAKEPAASTLVTDFSADRLGVAWITFSGSYTVKTRGTQGRVVLENGSASAVPGDACCIALDREAVYWLDSKHVWRSRRGLSEAEPLASVDDVPKGLAVVNRTAYVATDTTVSRLAVDGGTPEVMFSAPSGSHIVAIAVDGERVVLCLSSQVPKSDDVFRVETWRVDGRARRIGETYGDAEKLAIDGDIVALGVKTTHGDEVLRERMDGGSLEPSVAGTLVTAHGGLVYVSRKARSSDSSGTFAVDVNGNARRVGPNAIFGTVVDDRLYGVFTPDDSSVKVLGAIPIR